LIRLDSIDLNDANVRARLRQSLADVLAIDNPKWLKR
jgi:hypothetical protein